MRLCALALLLVAALVATACDPESSKGAIADREALVAACVGLGAATPDPAPSSTPTPGVTDASFFGGAPPLPTPVSPETDRKARKALAALYYATDGDNWTYNTNWLSDAPLGEWYGVETDYYSGLVIGLTLSNNSLIGNLPPELGNPLACET